VTSSAKEILDAVGEMQAAGLNHVEIEFSW
jgi:hypothetical protein